MSLFKKKEILFLYKQMQKEAKKFKNYNFKEYAKRRIKEGFQENKNENDVKKIEEFIQEAKIELESLKRQTILDSLYTKEQLVVEDK